MSNHSTVCACPGADPGFAAWCFYTHHSQIITNQLKYVQNTVEESFICIKLIVHICLGGLG